MTSTQCCSGKPLQQSHSNGGFTSRAPERVHRQLALSSMALAPIGRVCTLGFLLPIPEMLCEVISGSKVAVSSMPQAQLAGEVVVVHMLPQLFSTEEMLVAEATEGVCRA